MHRAGHGDGAIGLHAAQWQGLGMELGLKLGNSFVLSMDTHVYRAGLEDARAEYSFVYLGLKPWLMARLI